jgi:hypothetical protein
MNGDVATVASAVRDDISYPRIGPGLHAEINWWNGGCRGYIIVDIKWRSGQSSGFRCFARICFDIPPPHILVIHHRPPPSTDTRFPLAFYSLSFNLPSLLRSFRFIVAAVVAVREWPRISQTET